MHIYQTSENTYQIVANVEKKTETFGDDFSIKNNYYVVTLETESTAPDTTISDANTNNALFLNPEMLNGGEATYQIETVVVEGTNYYEGAMHPSGYKFAYNINMQTGEKYLLNESINVYEYSRKIMEENAYISSSTDADLQTDILDFNTYNNDVFSTPTEQMEMIYRHQIKRRNGAEILIICSVFGEGW